MKLSEMRQLLAERKIQLTKSLGQNFLHDANQVERIANCAQLGRDDKVLEIGPGLGPLTELLLRRAGRLLAIEKDRRLVDLLTERFGNAPNLQLIHADALEYLQQNHDWRDWKVVSNLPYSVGSRIVVELAQKPQPPALLVVTLQLEVAQRILAGPGSENYGLLSVLVQSRYEIGKHFKIAASCFFPQPEVDSACIVLQRRVEPLLAGAAQSTFVEVVKKAFSQRRKMMSKLLKKKWAVGQVEAAFSRAGLENNIRAEAVSVKQFVELAGVLSSREEKQSA